MKNPLFSVKGLLIGGSVWAGVVIISVLIYRAFGGK